MQAVPTLFGAFITASDGCAFLTAYIFLSEAICRAPNCEVELPWAISVAAQENAVSHKTIAEMKSILDKILKNTKISESKILSRLIQSNVVKSLRKRYRQIQDLGVKKAPFFVLVGARMPAILAEVSFMSNTQEGKRLKSTKYRQRIVNGIYDGIMAYVKSLGKI